MRLTSHTGIVGIGEAEPLHSAAEHSLDVAPSVEDRFTAFVDAVEPRLRRALAGAVGIDRAHDAVAAALAWAWEHWDDAEAMDNPAGYLYRVGRSSVRIRPRRRVVFEVPREVRMPDVEPGLVAALKTLSEQQRNAVWLVHGCDWTYAEAADALEVSASALGTHLSRGLAKLRTELGAVDV